MAEPEGQDHVANMEAAEEARGHGSARLGRPGQARNFCFS